MRFLSAGSLVPVPVVLSRSGYLGGLHHHVVAFPDTVLVKGRNVASFFIEGVEVSTGKTGEPQTVCRSATELAIAPRWDLSDRSWPVVSDALYPCGRAAVLPIVPGRSGTYPAVPPWGRPL